MKLAILDDYNRSALSLADWASLPSFQQLRARNGVVDVQDFPVGSYQFIVSGRGLKQVFGQIDVSEGSAAPPHVVRVPR